MDDEWDGHSVLHFHVINGTSTYVNVEDRSSKIFSQALSEYNILMKQYRKLHIKDSEISDKAYEEHIPTSYGNSGKYTYQEILTNERSSLELRKMVINIKDLWQNLRYNMEEQFCHIYLINTSSKSLEGPYLSTNGDENAIWCTEHLMSIYETVSELYHQYVVEEKATKAAKYSTWGFWIGLSGLIVGIISLIITIYWNL